MSFSDPPIMSSSLSDPSFSFFQSKTTSSSLRVYPDLTRVYPEPNHHHRDDDHFDRLPDSLLLLVFNKIGDVKSLDHCCVVSRHFHSLVPQRLRLRFWVVQRWREHDLHRRELKKWVGTRSASPGTQSVRRRGIGGWYK